VLRLFENPPAVAFKEEANAASVIERPLVLAPSAAPVTDCTTAPEPSVPEVSTPLNWITLHKQADCEVLPKLMAMVPVVGESPMALNRVVLFRGVPVVPQVTVFT
jgi:hypothetical protein